jgi:diguanylate cyclase (GGDEF)-like protein
VARDIVEVIREEEMLSVIREAAQVHLKLPAFALLLVRDGVVRVRAQKGFDDETLVAAEHPIDSSALASWFIKQREPVLVDDISSDGRFAGAMFPYRSLMALPMWARDEMLGALIAFDTRVRAFTRQDFMRANILAQQLALGIGKTSLYARIEELSITDGLTKLYRRSYFLDRFEGELGRARRYNRPVSLLIGDIDHFKQYNDTYGHPEGDEVLRKVSRALEDHFSRPAINARYGGEEFAVLLPDVPRETAIQMADRFRESFGSTSPGGGDERRPLTISVGVAAFPTDAQTRRDLISRADQALYRAKSMGRNRVCAYDSASVAKTGTEGV